MLNYKQILMWDLLEVYKLFYKHFSVLKTNIKAVSKKDSQLR